jgi:hypothetical protein
MLRRLFGKINMDIKEFKKRAALQYHKIRVVNFKQFLDAMGYHESCQTAFKTHGVSRRAIAYLELLEKADNVRI